MNLSEVHQKRFWELAEQDLSNPENIMHSEETGGAHIRSASRYLKKTIPNLDVSWITLSAFALVVKLNQKNEAARLAKFFSGEGWVEERSHWREGPYHVYVLELRPQIVSE